MDKEIQRLMKDKIKSKSKGKLKEAAEICNYIGKLHSDNGRHQEAIEEHEEELSLCKESDDLLGTALASRCIGEVSLIS